VSLNGRRKFNGVTGQKTVFFVVNVVGTYIPLNEKKKLSFVD